MTAVDDILASLPIDQLAEQVGADPADVQRAVTAAVPALLGGLGANAQDGGADSLLNALGQHDNSLLTGGVNLDDVDTTDGSRIAGHIFGSQEDAVVSQLGGLQAASSGGSLGGDLVKKLIPILAPIVLSYLAGKIFGGKGSTSTSGGPVSVPSGGGALPTPSGSGGGQAGGPGSLQDMLQDVLGSAIGGATGSGSAANTGTSTDAGSSSAGGVNAGSIITDILGGLLGGGRR